MLGFDWHFAMWNCVFGFSARRISDFSHNWGRKIMYLYIVIVSI